jgi:hypothetical protein
MRVNGPPSEPHQHRGRPASWSLPSRICSPSTLRLSYVSDRPGVNRAIAVRKELNGGNNVCLRDLPPRVKHRHERRPVTVR